MIPKVINYIWFGNRPLSSDVERCIDSWRRFFPDFEIVRWDESNFDLDCCNYFKQAYKAKKWAFASDYARIKILYDNGGIYFDTDVEVISNYDDILKQGPFMGCETSPFPGKECAEDPYSCLPHVNLGLGFASEQGNSFLKELLDEYQSATFDLGDGGDAVITITERVTLALYRHGLRPTDDVQEICGFFIYPKEFFSPKDIYTRELNIGQLTHSIHHFDGSWLPDDIIKYIELKDLFADKLRFKGKLAKLCAAVMTALSLGSLSIFKSLKNK